MQNPDITMFSSKLIGQFACSVLAAVIYKDQFPAIPILQGRHVFAKNVKMFYDECFFVVTGNDDGDEWKWIDFGTYGLFFF